VTNSWLFRIGIVLVVIGVLGGIAAGIARGRWDGDQTRTIEYRVVNQDGQPVPGQQQPIVVVEPHGGYGPGPFFPVFPLVFFGGILIVAAIFVTRDHDRRRGWRGPDNGGGGGTPPGDSNLQQPSSEGPRS